MKDSGALSGVKIVEVGFYVGVPATAAILADWGAEVIKIEPLQGGDPYRGYTYKAFATTGGEFRYNYAWQLDNRNKKSVAIDLRVDKGKEILFKLLRSSDVFLTSLTAESRRRLGIDYEHLQAVNKRLVYGSITGYGTEGPQKNEPGFDYGAFWARSGIMDALGEPDSPAPVNQLPAMGDHIASLALASAICAALIAKERTGEGQEVSTSLLQTATWVASSSFAETLLTKKPIPRISRLKPRNPLFNTYKTLDQWVIFTMPQSEIFWADFCYAIGREDLVGDNRFRSLQAREENSSQLVHIIEKVLSTRTLQEWAVSFNKYHLIYSPLINIHDAITDVQAVENKHFAILEHPSYGKMHFVASPAHFSETPACITKPGPEHGQDTENVLLQLGYDWNDIEEFKHQRVSL